MGDDGPGHRSADPGLGDRIKVKWAGMNFFSLNYPSFDPGFRFVFDPNDSLSPVHPVFCHR
jgi:hypothetical protein